MGKRGAARSLPVSEPRKLKRLSIDEEANKKCYDNFKTLSDEEVHVVKMDGVTLLDAVKQKIYAKRKNPSVALGRLWYEAQRKRYRSQNHPLKLLKPPTPLEQVPHGAVLAMHAVKRNHLDFGKMITYVAQATTPNRTELCGILRWGYGLSPKSAVQLPAIVSFLKYLGVIKFKAEYPFEFEFFIKTIDTFLDAMLKKAGKKMDPDVFVKTNLKLCALLMPETALVNVLAAEKKWDTVKEALTDISSLCETGLHLYGFASLAVVAADGATFINTHIDAFLVAGPITEASLNTAIFDTSMAVNNLPNVNLLPRKRDVNTNFGGALLLRTVGSVDEEVTARYDAAWKAAAAAQNAITKIVGEELVAQTYTFVGAPGKVDAELCLKTNAARAEWARIYRESAPATCDELLRLARENKLRLGMLDGKWLIEAAILESVAGAGSEARLGRAILTHFPTAATSVSEEDCLQRINAMRSAPSYKFASLTAQARHGFVVKILTKLVDGEPPALGMYVDDVTMQMLIPQLGYFVRFDKPSASASAASCTVTGGEALKLIFDQVTTKKIDGDTLTKKDVVQLKAYAHLVPADLNDECASLVREAEDGATDLLKKKLPGTRGVKKVDKAMHEALSMFAAQ